MTELEKDLEAVLTNKVRAAGGMCLKWNCPGWVGVPDRIILLPEGRVIFAELKKPKTGRVAPLQKWWNEKLTKLGFTALFIRNREDLKILEALIEL